MENEQTQGDTLTAEKPRKRGLLARRGAKAQPESTAAPAPAEGGQEPKARGRRALRAEKAEQKQMARAESAAEKREGRDRTVRAPALLSMITEAPPSRDQLEQEAAAEFSQAIAPSMDLLTAAVPDASSPEEAWRAIESRLGKPIKDPEAELPDHPLYSGDALVYYQLRRHYGQPSTGGSFRRGWEPGSGGMPPMLG